MKEFLITYAIGTLLEALKQPALHAPLKKAMLKIFKALLAIYARETEFRAAISVELEKR